MKLQPFRIFPVIAAGSLFVSLIVPSLASAASFSQNHSLWDSGPDILTLQQWLNANGYPIASSGPGSAGQETDTFGLSTLRALEAFQQAHGLPVLGYLGPMTRAVLNGSTPSTATNSSNAPSLSASQIQAILSLLQSFGADHSTIQNVSAALGTPTTQTATPAASTTPEVPTTIPSVPGGYTPGYGGGGETPSSPAPADTTPPSVTLTAPTSGATLSGSSVTLTATASDNIAVNQVQFEVDGTEIGSAITSSPYTTTWDSTGVVDGTYTLYAVAEDTSGNYATSSIGVTVDNTPVVISSITTSSIASSSVTITWTTNKAATSDVNFGFTTSYGTASSSATLVTSHSVEPSGLSASTTYDFQVSSADNQGILATSSNQVFTTIPSWVLSGATVDLDFANGQYYGDSLSDMLSVSRASSETCDWADGHVTYAVANQPCITDQGWQSDYGASTNLILQSTFNNTSPWTLFHNAPSADPTVTPNTAVAPDGTMTATRVTWTGNTGTGTGFRHTVSPTDNIPYAACIWLKGAAGGETVALFLQQASSPYNNWAIVTLSLTTSWVRYQIAGTVLAGSSNFLVAATPPSTAGTFYVWNANMELATGCSPDVISGASQVTRDADVITINPTSLLGAALQLPNTVTVSTNNSLQSVNGTMLGEGGTALMQKLTNNTCTMADETPLSSSNTGTWTGPNSCAVTWGATAGAINLNGTITAHTNERATTAPLYLGSIGGRRRSSTATLPASSSMDLPA